MSDLLGTTRSENIMANGDPVPPVGEVTFGDLKRLYPISTVFGLDRGTCIDRYYIERFLAEHRGDIHGRVLEIADNAYTRRFGGDRVTHSDVLHFPPGNRQATIVDDLTAPAHLSSASYDCVILTQTLQHIYDVRSAIATTATILRPGGVVLATVPGISQISRYDMERWGDFWRFTTLSLRRLWEESFPADQVRVCSHGNVHIATAFLHGLVVEDVSEDDLLLTDDDYQFLLTVRAQKRADET